MGETVVVATDDPGWQAFVERRPDATAFHRAGWADTLAAGYGFETFVVARRDGGEVSAGMPMASLGRRRSRRWVSLPFTDACSPLGDRASVGALLCDLELLRAARGVESVEVRGSVDEAVGASIESGVIHELPLDPDPATVRAGLHPSQARRNVDRASREGVEVVFTTEQDALLGTFYRLHLLTRRRQGVPIQPRRFFARLWEHVIARNEGFVVVAMIAGRPAAAAVFLDGNGTLTYKFGASDPDLLRVRPNHAVFWAAIEWACLAGRHTFDMGRTDAENAGLRAFKSSWGATERPLVYTTFGRTHAAARDRARLLRPVIAHSPLVVCRALGEALYRRAA